MTNVEPAGGSQLAVPQGGLVMPDGLEDMTASDITTPRIQIDHKKAVFVDSQSNEVFPSLDNCIILGLAKQRVLWPADVGNEKQNPMCKSFDAKTGHAVPASFPWKSTAFDPVQFPREQEGTDFERILLPCADCSLIVWDTHPRRETPWCTAQNTLIVLMNYDGIWMPAIISFQRSGLKACNTYLSTFAKTQKPTYTALTTIELTPARRGDNDYAIPKFTKGEATDPANWPYFSQTMREVRDYLTASLRGGDGEGSDESGSEVLVDVGADPANNAISTPSSAPVAATNPVAPAAPAAPAPAAPTPPAAPMAPAPPVPQPATNPATTAPVATPNNPPQPPVTQPVPASGSTVPAGGGEPDDLPF